jgi:hypothetical protein
MSHTVQSLNNAYISSKKAWGIVFMCLTLVLFPSCETAIITPLVTSAPPSTFTPTLDPNWALLDNNWLQLYYPQDWNLKVTNCASDNTDCIVSLSDLPSLAATTEIGVVIFPPTSEPSDVVQVDEKEWLRVKRDATLIGAVDFLKLISIEEITVDKIRAIKRLYEYPVLDNLTGNVTGTLYIYHVMLVHGEHVVSFEMQSKNKDKFAQYLPIAEHMVDTVIFHQ